MYTIYKGINAFVYLMSACSAHLKRHINNSIKPTIILFWGKL